MLLSVARGKVSEGIDFGKLDILTRHVTSLIHCGSVDL